MSIKEIEEKLKAGKLYIYNDDKNKIELLRTILVHVFGLNEIHHFEGKAHYYSVHDNDYDRWGGYFCLHPLHNCMESINLSAIKMEKKKQIIGYKIKEGYEEQVKAILPTFRVNYENAFKDILNNYKANGYHFLTSISNESFEGYFNRFNILNNWFDPVYKEDKPQLPNINNYEGKYDGTYITYGYAKFKGTFFKALKGLLESDFRDQNRLIKSFVLDSGINLTIPYINQIVKFIEWEEKQKS